MPFRPAGTAPEVTCPITVAWAEVWASLSEGMSRPGATVSPPHGPFLAAPRRGRLTAGGTRLDCDAYLELRRRTVGIHHSIDDAAERSRRFEVPAQIQATR